MATPRLLVGFASALAIALVAFIVAIVVGEWWVLPVALLAHAVGFLIVMAMIAPRTAEDREKPGPVTETRLEEEAAERSGVNGRGRSEDEPQVFH